MSEEFNESVEQNELLDQENNQDVSAEENDDVAENDKEENNDENQEPEVYGSPEDYDYSEIKLPEGMTLDKELVDKFNPLAKKYNLSQKSANELMNLAVELVGKNTPDAAKLSNEIQIAERNQYLKMLNDDKELNAMNEEQYGEYINLARLGVNSVATETFKNVLKEKGLANHPEFIKTFYKIGKLCNSDTVPNGKIPPQKEISAADILYGKKD